MSGTRYIMASVTRIVACAALALAATSCDEGDDGAVVEVRHDRSAVLGLPVPVQLVVHGPVRFVPSHFGSGVNPFECELRSGDDVFVFPAVTTNEVVLPRLSYRVGRSNVLNVPARTCDLGAGDACEILVDLSSLRCVKRGRRSPAEFAAIPPGTYELAFIAPDVAFDPPRTTITLVRPNVFERRVIERASRDDGRGAKRMDFVGPGAPFVDDAAAGRLSAAGRRQLAYHLYVSRLVRSAAPVAEVELPPFPADALPGIDTELMLVRYEVECARGAPRADLTRENVLALRPSARRLLDRIARGAGAIAAHRSPVDRTKRARRIPGPGFMPPRRP